MKEIDFLPDWYKQGRVQQRKHREFYVALVLIVFIMFAWSIFANGRVAIVKARITTLENSRLMQSSSETEYTTAEKEYQQLKVKSDVLESVESRIVVSNILAELSYLLDGKVVLKRIEIKPEPFKSQDGQTGIRTVSSTTNGRTLSIQENELFKITLSGYAVDAANVAEIINKLDESEYFFQVIPVFSRNAKVGEYQTSEFEITCYLSNFKQN